VRLGRDVQLAIHDKVNALIALIELHGAARPAGRTGPEGGLAAERPTDPYPPKGRPGGQAAAPFGSVSLREAIAQAQRASRELIPA